MTLLNLSFSACGFLGIYHLGAAAALHLHGEKLLGTLNACAGASAGALVATVLVTVPEKIEDCKEFTYRFADEVRKQKLGAMTPGYDFMHTLKEGIEHILPPNAHEIAGNRLSVSITHSKTGENCMVSSFSSREDLIKKWIDGGLSNSLPVLPVGRTVTVSPFIGRYNICPKDSGLMNVYIKLAKQDIRLSKDNIIRLSQALFPPMQEKMEVLYQNGYDDAVQFLRKENWFQ
ncbi:patatin-like phospholipase domain-containing protein 4 isoform X2 [Polyodon spathula]|uniref:patatin-like phospholipase domain-containing protein 4 isoform X2 n=1 Tax=Polyodon spathula TaxID=7913 RepID=UPI001B7F46FF|nr:patatin-like phospholipase domain-containing protein 4 isoform X2 [Polyodon spathula]